MKTYLSLSALSLLGVLAACGGGSSSNEAAAAAPREVPASAYASPSAYTSFASGQATDEQAEPLAMDGMTVAPTSETDEPA